MFKYWKKKKPDCTGEPAIDANDVTDAHLDTTNFEHGRYIGRLLNPDDMFWPEPSRMPKPGGQNSADDAQQHKKPPAQ